MELSHARYLADSVVAKLVPVCERVMICGGIRRHKPNPHDIDLVVIPHRDTEKDMFGQVSGYHVVPEFVTAINQWTKIKGDPDGKYTQRLLADGVNLEISMCTNDNWGCLTMIRTGDSDFTHMMMIRARKLGFEQRDGYLWKDDKRLSIPDERIYFEVLNLPYIEPEMRTADAFKRVSS
jgi:DNA polymerase/3'-5' exonuclease PolX